MKLLSKEFGVFSLVILALSLGGCGKIPNLPNGASKLAKPNPPEVTISAVALVSAPSNTMLAMHFCPTVANSFVCRAIGSAPSLDKLKFVFDVELLLENPNDVALPAAEAMVAFTAYPESSGSDNTGAVCVALCPEGEECGAPPEDGCTDTGSIKSMNDFAAASVGFLANVALGTTTISDIKIRTIPAKESTTVKVRLELNVNAMLSLIGKVAGDALSSVKSGKVPSFEIPFRLEGTVWVSVESFGKIAAGFGPHADTWKLTD